MMTFLSKFTVFSLILLLFTKLSEHLLKHNLNSIFCYRKEIEPKWSEGENLSDKNFQKLIS